MMLEPDVHRQFGTWSWSRLAKLYLRDRGFRPIVTLRLYQHTRQRPLGWLLYPFIWLWHRRATRRAGMDLPLRTAIGPGLKVAHSVGIVVSQEAQIGANVTLCHGVTIGSVERIGHDGQRMTAGSPVIEDGVWIGPHAVVVGPVRVGAGSRILANAVVTEDVPPKSMVAYNPGEVVRENCAPDVPNPAPVDGAMAIPLGEEQP